MMHLRVSNDEMPTSATDRVVVTFQLNSEQLTVVNLGFRRHEVSEFFEPPLMYMLQMPKDETWDEVCCQKWMSEVRENDIEKCQPETPPKCPNCAEGHMALFKGCSL